VKLFSNTIKVCFSSLALWGLRGCPTLEGVCYVHYVHTQRNYESELIREQCRRQ